MTAVRRMQLARLGIWVGLATVAVLTAVLTARTETGVRRIATLLSPAPAELVRSAKAPAPQIASRPFDQEAEQRRLSEAIRTLAADRDRLAARLNMLERNIEDVTGSIGPAAKASQLPGIPAIPAPGASGAGTSTPGASAPAAGAGAAQNPAPGAPSQTRVAAGHLVTSNPTAAESVATKTEFGVDLGGNATIDGLRTMWSNLKATQPAMLEGLRPVIAIREGAKPGSMELRLVAGPLANASIAARLCAALIAAGQSCQPTVFDGQRLALQ
jgi:hypothetical protein